MQRIVLGFCSLAISAVCASPILASEEKFKAVTTFTVIADMARNVAGGAAIVESVTKAGAEIHGYQPTPRDIIRAQDADLILWNGLNLELWFEQFFSNLKDVPSVTLTDGVVPMSISGGDYNGKPNPHAWMSTTSAMIYENAAIYTANAETYKNEITAVIKPLEVDILAVPEGQRWLVSCEGAFSYLIRDFQMQELYLWPINADQQGTPQQVRKVIDSVRANNIPAVFCESTVSQSPAQQVARETDAIYGGMLYVDSLTEADGAVPTYIDLLRTTIETIATGLSE
jgi:manganese/iron transport system substrate-binding protein